MSTTRLDRRMKTTETARDFPLAPLHRLSWGLPVAVWLALVIIAYLQPHQQPPTNPVPWWLVIPFAIALVVIGPLIMLMHRRVHLKDRSLVVEAAVFYTRRIALDDLLLDRARIISLDEHVEFKPVLPLFAFGLPGFKAGHYLLRNRRRAFCLLTDRRRVLMLPQRDGKLLLLSPEKPRALLDELLRITRSDAPPALPRRL